MTGTQNPVETTTGSADRTTSPVRANTPLARRGDLIPCQASMTTTSFGLHTEDGETLMFDTESNGRILVMIEKSEEWQRALREVNLPSVAVQNSRRVPTSPRTVELTGRRSGNELAVESSRLANPVPTSNQR